MPWGNGARGQSGVGLEGRGSLIIETRVSPYETATGLPPLVAPVLAVANFAIGMCPFVILGILNPIADDLSLTASEVGALMSGYAFAYAILSPVLVSVTGRIGRQRVLAAALTVFVIGAALLAMAESVFVLHLARILAAVGAGLVSPVAAGLGSARPTGARADGGVFWIEPRPGLGRAWWELAGLYLWLAGSVLDRGRFGGACNFGDLDLCSQRSSIYPSLARRSRSDASNAITDGLGVLHRVFPGHAVHCFHLCNASYGRMDGFGP